MNRLRNLDPRQRAADQKINQTTSVIGANNSPGVTTLPSNGNSDQQEPRPKVSSLVFKFGGDRNRKVPTYTFSPAEQNTIDQQQHNLTSRTPSSPQIKIYIEQLEAKNSELIQKLTEQSQQVEHSENKMKELNKLCNILQNKLNQEGNDPLLQLVLNFCEVTSDQQNNIISLFESKIHQCKRNEQQVKSLTTTLKSKEQRITELTNEVNELVAKMNAVPTLTSLPRSNASISTTPIKRIDSTDELDSINLRRELYRTRSRLKEAQRELSSQNSLTRHLSANNLLSSDTLISDLRKEINDMGWEIKSLQKTKETLKHDVEKLEKEIVTLESQKKSVLSDKAKITEDTNAMITRENKELRATIEELNDQNRIVLQNYHNHVKNYAIHEGVMSKLHDSMAQLEKENSQLKEKCVFLEEKLALKQISLVDKNELEKLNSSNRVLTLQYDYEVAKREHCERQLARLQDNIKQLQSELLYMDEKIKRANEQMKLADRLTRDNKDECEVLQLKIMDLEKRLNLTEKDKDIVEQELLIVKQKMEATTYRIQRYNEALINADNDLELMSDTSFSEDVGSVNGTETISLKSRNSHPTGSQSEV